MESEPPTAHARCDHCRSEVAIPESYAHGDHIKCGSCGTKHKVVRGDILRLVVSDVGPLQEALRANEQRLDRLEAEHAHARASFGVGANGVGLGVIYVLWAVTRGGETWSSRLVWTAGAVAVGGGLLLELANYLFLAKRRAMSRLALEIETAHLETVRLKQKIRDASRV